MEDRYFYIKVVNIPIYKGNLVMILSNDKDKISKLDKGWTKEDIYAHAIHGEYKNFEAFYIVLDIKNSSKITNGVIAHEAFHVAEFIAESRGFIPDFENNESVAYILEWVTDQIHKFIIEKGFKIYERS